MRLRLPLDVLEPNPYGEQTTLDSAIRCLQKIRTVQSWVSNQGTGANHTQGQMDAIESLLVNGTMNYPFDPPFEVMQLMQPRLQVGCPGTWYIFINSENGMDAQLYEKLYEATQLLPGGVDGEDLQAIRMQLLYCVELLMKDEVGGFVNARHQMRVVGRAPQSADPPCP